MVDVGGMVAQLKGERSHSLIHKYEAENELQVN